MRRRRNLALILGVIVAVMVVGVAAVLAVTLAGGGGDDAEQADKGGGERGETSTSAAAPDTITYEITGTSASPLDTVYTGSDGKDVEKTVRSLPWSVTVDPAPDFVSIFALPTSIEAPNPNITLTLKRGDEVLRECKGGGPCLMPYP